MAPRCLASQWNCLPAASRVRRSFQRDDEQHENMLIILVSMVYFDAVVPSRPTSRPAAANVVRANWLDEMRPSNQLDCLIALFSAPCNRPDTPGRLGEFHPGLGAAKLRPKRT